MTFMMPVALPNGKLRVPRRAESPGMIGDGLVDIGPDDPDFAAWKAALVHETSLSTLATLKRDIALTLVRDMDIELGKDGSSWKHDYIPLNAAAIALKAHKSPKGEGAATPGAVQVHAAKVARAKAESPKSDYSHGFLKGHESGRAPGAKPRVYTGGGDYARGAVEGHNGALSAVAKAEAPKPVTSAGVTGSVGNMTDVSALRAAAAKTVQTDGGKEIHKADAAATMHGIGSPKHLAAIKRFGVGPGTSVTRNINGVNKVFDVTAEMKQMQGMNLETVRGIATGSSKFRGQLVDSHIRAAAFRVYKARSGGKNPSDPFGNSAAIARNEAARAAGK